MLLLDAFASDRKVALGGGLETIPQPFFEDTGIVGCGDVGPLLAPRAGKSWGWESREDVREYWGFRPPIFDFM